MTVADNVQTITLLASGALPLYRFVSLSSGQAALSGAGANMVGVTAQEALVADEPIAVAELQGVMKVEAGAAVSQDDDVASDASGRAVTAVATNTVGGSALDAAGAAGEIIRVLLTKRQI